MAKFYIVEQDDGDIVHAKSNSIKMMKNKLLRMFKNGFCDCFLMTEKEYKKLKKDRK